MSLTPPPTAPSTSDPATFAARADALVAWYATNVTELGALQTDVAAKQATASAAAGTATADAAAAAASALAAALSAGAVLWVSGTTYAVGFVVYSPANYRIYRRKTAGAGTTDPSGDGTNWAVVNGDLIAVNVNTSTATLYAGTYAVVVYAGACTLTLATPAPGDRYRVSVANGRNDVAINIGAETLRGRNGSLSGTITMDQQGTLEMIYIDSTTKLVVV